MNVKYAQENSTLKIAMVIRKRVKGFIKALSSPRSTSGSDAVDLADTHAGQGSQAGVDVEVSLNTNGSTADQVSTNESIKQSESLRNPVTPLSLENIPVRELWNVAYEKLREEDGALIAEYEAKMRGSVVAGLAEALRPTTNVRERMWAILQSKMDEVNNNTMKLKLGSAEVTMKDAAQLVLSVVGSANDYITQAVGANPYASIAWAGVSFLLPLFMNISSQSASLAEGLEYISSLISQSQMREEIYIRRYESQPSGHEDLEFQQSHRQYKAALERLYRQILRFQAKSCCYYTNSSASRHGLAAVRWNDWDQLINDVRKRDTEFAAVEQIWRDVQRLKERLADESAMSQNERKELLDWLCSVDPSSLYNTARERHEAGTNEWLLKDSKDFKTWETTAGSLLWLHGKAGSGKSVLSSSVISYLKTQYGPKLSAAFAYFYFSFSDVEKQKVDVMLASLIKQIYHCRSHIPELDRLADYKARNERPDTETLEAEFKASISKLSAAYIVIDGLDECPLLGRQRDKLLKSLRRILSGSLENLHVFLTSRKEPDVDLEIRDLLCPPSRIEIDLLTHQEMLNNDIRQHIVSTLATNSFKSWPPSVKEEAEQLLLEKADCMFQYVRFQLEILQEASSEYEIRKALRDLPIGLDATYNRIFENISAKFRAQVINSLKWLAFSRRTLTIEELSEIFIIDPDNNIAFDEEARLFSSSDIFKYFSGLIITQRAGFNDGVRLVHFSLKEYLTSDRLRESHSSTFSFTEFGAHLYIARCCLAYLAYISTKGTIGFHYPLVRYVANFWALHLEEIPRESWPARVTQDAVLALAIHSQSLLIQILMSENSLPRYSHLLAKPHCYAAMKGCSQLAEVLISPELTNHQYLTQEDLDCGLQYATWRRNMDIVRLFLKAGANINADCGLDNYKSAVDVAVRVGNYDALKLFASHGADVECLAAQHRGIESLKFLLELGAKMDGQRDGGCGTALHQALCSHDTGSVDLLLERGAGVNAPSKKLGTPLQAACTIPSIGVSHLRLLRAHTRKLLDYGADPNIQGGDYATALQAVCHTGLRRGNLLLEPTYVMGVVQLLIEGGADVNIQGGEYGTALHAAAASLDSRAVEVMKLLVDNGAKVDQQGGDNWGTALQVACHEGTMEAVRFLLDHGADVNAEGGRRFGTPLQAAAARKTDRDQKRIATFWLETKLQMLQMLISKGAKVNHQGGEWGTALQAACDNNNLSLEVVSLLLEHGADVNANGGRHGTALMATCKRRVLRRNDTECVRLLLDRGGDVNAKSEELGTALTAVCQTVTVRSWGVVREVAQLLLDRGADVNVQGDQFGTALSGACRRGHSELVQLLLRHGADIHLQDCAAWHAAARSCIADVLRLLLDRGMDVNHVHGEHGTALHVIMGKHGDAMMRIYGKGVAKSNQDGDGSHNWRRSLGLLLQSGIDASIVNERLGSALHVACATKHDERHVKPRRECSGCSNVNYASEKTQYLVQQNPDIDVDARGGVFGSALQAAAYSGQTLSVRLLLGRKADVNMRGGRYRSALNGAIVSGYWDIVEVLLNAGATPDCHLQEHLDEEWLQTVHVEDGRGAVERYRRFWDVQMERRKEAQTTDM
ncbi:ankyrin repeat-containing domain protein [Trichoderma chlorosporum]